MNLSIGQPKQDPEVILTFDGETIIKETVGFEGSDCIKETAFIMEGLGAQDNKRKLKPEYLKAGKKVKTERIHL
jgi:hypothetical protein